VRQKFAAYGLPQAWNSEGKMGPDRDIETQIWDNVLLGIE
jgi:hypothetical protein